MRKQRAESKTVIGNRR